MAYVVEVSRFAEKFVAKLRQDDRDRIRAVFRSLVDEPRPHGCLKMKGYANRYRIRSDRYRIIYSIYDAELTVDVIDVDDRMDAYRG